MFNHDEIFLYHDSSYIEDTLKLYLPRKEYLREVGLNAQKRCYAEHDISVRIKQLDKIIKELV